MPPDDLVDKLLREARIYSWRELEDDASLPPTRPGVYAWFFDEVPEVVPLTGCFEREGAHLLYAGISPRRTSSTQNLRKRIRYHFQENAEGSTLRLTLGCLLERKLGTVLRRVGSGYRMTFGPFEAALTHWMAGHARVSWVVTGDPKEVETRLISSLCLPLNMDQNATTPFYQTIRKIRREARERAMVLPILPS